MSSSTPFPVLVGQQSNADRLMCSDRLDLYRPQWAFLEPDDSRDETFIVGPFSLEVAGTGALSLNLPVQLDDDVPFFIRAFYLGTLSVAGEPPEFLEGSLVRIRDTYGNPLTDGLINALGAWSGARDGWNAFGFVCEQEVECSPGGALLFDIQASSSGAAATFVKAGTFSTLTFTAAVFGAAGNGATIALVNPGAPNVPLSVAVVGRAVTVTLATNGGSAITSTYQDIFNLINSTPAVLAVMFVTLVSTNTAEVITALAVSPLATGANGAPFAVVGTLIGVKRFQRCL